MKDVKLGLQAEYYRLLNGNVTVPAEVYPAPVRPDDDYVVPVYDSIPTDATFPYIKIQEWTEVDFSDKTTFGGNVTLTLQIVDRYEGTASPRSVMYTVLEGVKEIIRSRPLSFNVDGWNIITSVVDGEDTIREMDATHTYIYTNIRFRHLAEQLTAA